MSHVYNLRSAWMNVQLCSRSRTFLIGNDTSFLHHQWHPFFIIIDGYCFLWPPNSKWDEVLLWASVLRLVILSRRLTLGRVLVVSNFFHVTDIIGTKLLRTLMALEMGFISLFWLVPHYCCIVVLFRESHSSLHLMCWVQSWHASYTLINQSS